MSGTLQTDYPKCMIKSAFRPEQCSKCTDESQCDMVQWYHKQAEKEQQEKQAREQRRKEKLK